MSMIRRFGAAFFAAFLVSAAVHAETHVLNDGQIAEIVMTANKAEIAAGELARKRANHPAVKEFAVHMVSQHRDNSEEAKKMMNSAGIKKRSNPFAKSLKEDAERMNQELKGLKGFAFERGYITQQVAMHERLLKDLETQLIPAAKHPSLKSFLERTKDHVQGHLEQARKIMAEQPKDREEA